MKKALFLFFLLVQQFLYAQGDAVGVEYRQKVGLLAAHHAVMGHMVQGQAFAGEWSVYFQTQGRKHWHAGYKFPVIGISYFYGTAGNDQILGRFHGIYGFNEFSFVKRQHFLFNGKLAAGLGYTNKVFDQQSNPKNVAMSTHVNALICLGLKTDFLLGKSKISFGLDITHFSNGSYKVPNLGVNLPFVSLGYGHYVGQRKHLVDTLKPHIVYKKWTYGFTLIGSVKEVFPTNGPKYPVIAVSGFARRFYRPRIGLETSIDVMYKEAIYGYRAEIEKRPIDIWQAGIFAGYLMPLDRFHYVLGMGMYLRDKYQPDTFLYHRVGMRYRFDSGIVAQVVLKSHWAKADYVEWGIGYTFKSSKK